MESQTSPNEQPSTSAQQPEEELQVPNIVHVSRTLSTQPKNYHKCSFIGCTRKKHRYPESHFFTFPVNRPDICQKWVINCANEVLTTLPNKSLCKRLVCEKHFTVDSFTNTMRTRVHKTAIPTLVSHEIDDSTSGTDQPLAPSHSLAVDLPLPLDSGELQLTYQSSRRTLFQTAVQTPIAQKDPNTPPYKKYKSVKGRKQTPKKELITPKKIKLLSRLKKTIGIKNKYKQAAKRHAKQKIKVTKAMLMSAMQCYLPENVVNFFSMQLKHSNSKIQWTEGEKQQALTMRYKSPVLYDHLRKQGFALPSPSTIGRWLQIVDLRPGICSELLYLLKSKVECMSTWEKKTILMFDEMSIKSSLDYDSKRDLVEGLVDLGEGGRKPSPGSHVLVFMARGLIQKWKMPICYFVTNHTVTAQTLSNLISKCISAGQSLGLDIRAVVCDQGSTNRKAAKLLGANKVNPHFTVDNINKVYFFFDISHVIKCVRNNLLKSKDGNFVGQIMTNEGTADWSHINSLYQLDRDSIKARATKLTDKHMAPNSFEKMSVKLATQIFSHSVSSAISTAVETQQLPPNAQETAAFLLKMNNLFDAMNSRTKFHPNPYQCAISSSNNNHLKTALHTVQNGLEWVKTWKMKNCKSPPCFDGMEQSLNATLLLWDDLKKEGVSYLLTGRLNQDPLENEFSIARQKCGYNRNPSAMLFRQNLRHRIQAALLTPPATGTNCEPDEDELLSTLTDPCSSGRSLTDPCSSGSINQSIEICQDSSDYQVPLTDIEEDDEDDPSLPMTAEPSLEACSVRYFAGYAVRACLRKYKCETCKIELTKQPGAPESTDEFLITNRSYAKKETDVGGLTIPSDSTTSTVSILLHVFDNEFKRNIHVVGLKSKILLKAKQWIFKEEKAWMKPENNECYNHRQFILIKIIVAKLRRSLNETSKDMRQPGGKKSSCWRKVQNLMNK